MVLQVLTFQFSFFVLHPLSLIAVYQSSFFGLNEYHIIWVKLHSRELPLVLPGPG